MESRDCRAGTPRIVSGTFESRSCRIAAKKCRGRLGRVPGKRPSRLQPSAGHQALPPAPAWPCACRRRQQKFNSPSLPLRRIACNPSPASTNGRRWLRDQSCSRLKAKGVRHAAPRPFSARQRLARTRRRNLGPSREQGRRGSPGDHARSRGELREIGAASRTTCDIGSKAAKSR